MSTQVLHPTPDRNAVAREQLRAVGLGVRVEMLVFGGLLLLFSVLVLYNQVVHDRPARFDLLPGVALPLLFLSFLVPLSVWKDEGPSRRTYLLAMPVERGWHQLAKNASGWLWLMGVVAVYLLWAWAMAALTGGDIGVESTRVFIGEDPRRATPEDFRAIHSDVPAWQWAVPFVGATAAYLLGSIVALSTDHPWRWIAGIVVGYFLTVAVLDASEQDRMEEALKSVVSGQYGLETLFSGETRQEMEYVVQDGELVVRLDAPLGAEADHTRTGAATRVVSMSHQQPDLSAWLVSVALWMGVGVLGVLFAAYHHRDS